jgi:hypothetical protein
MRKGHLQSVWLVLGWCLCCVSLCQAGKFTLYRDPDNIDGDLVFQGEYAGTVQQSDGSTGKLGGQVRAMGHGLFRTMFFGGGLPGDGWDGKTIVEKAPCTSRMVPDDSKLDGDHVVIQQIYTGTCDGKTVRGKTNDGREFTLQRVSRTSPTMGKAPPPGAIVLFDGTNADEWKPTIHITKEKWLSCGDAPRTKRLFQDFTLHVEFMIPCVPETRDIEDRPNSGVYLQDRYEIQVLDSFGVTMDKHDCGVLYGLYTPEVNMCYPPLTWQTYDIDFTAARWDESGKKTKNARVTVRFNGVLTIDDKEASRATGGGGLKETPEPGGIYLQRHTSLAFYRNIWLVENKPAAPK